MIRLLKITGWFILALALLIFGSLAVSVRLLHPARLTPLIQAAANRYLNADVSLGRAELSLSGSFPFLEIQLDDLTVVARDMRRLSPELHNALPRYADTLLTLRQLRGGINISKLPRNEVELGNVTFTAPGINIVVVSENLNNFNIVPPSESTEPSGPLPRISIRRFAIVDPKPFRYYNHADSSELALNLNSVLIEGENTPRYTCDFRGAVPLDGIAVELLRNVPFNISGDVIWDASTPELLGLENFDFDISLLGGRFDTHLNFERDLTVNDLHLKLKPLPLGELLAMLPDDKTKEWNLPDGISTTARPEIEITLDKPYNTAATQMPYATVNLLIAPSEVTLSDARFDNFAAEASAQIFGDDLNLARLALKKITLRGPATDISISGNVTGFNDDPLFDLKFDGNLDIRRLPRILTRQLGGYASGKIETRLSISGRPSMFRPGSYYKLAVAGELNGRRLYWLSSDTANMIYANHARIQFGNNRNSRAGQRGKVQILRAVVDIDSVNVLHTQYAFNATDFHLAAGTRNQRRNADTTALTPVGGGLRIGKFNFNLLSDSITVRARSIDGKVAMRGADGDLHRPQFDFDLGIARLATGDPTTRFMLSRANVNFSAFKLPRRQPPEALKKMADSIKTARPDLPPDSVYALAMEKYRHRRHRGLPRVHADITEQDYEIIDWGTSRQLRQLLLDWRLDGKVVAKRVSLFTPYFPIRNRIRNFNLAFNNDTIRLDNVEYKVGHSDFLLSGQITNLRRGLTSRRHRQSVKANFDLLSDTIDINQLADLTFRGAAYSEHKTANTPDLEKFDNEESFDREIDRYVANSGDSTAPLLVPRNIEAVIKVRADNVLYSNLTLHDLTGEALIYGGALNLHKLKARSDIGSVSLSALYHAPSVNDLTFGFGLDVSRFDIHGFLGLVPAIDSVMPLIRDFDGIIDADIAATVKLHRNMDFDMPSLQAAVNISGDSLRLIDAETYRKIGKWLLFKNKGNNLIHHMTVEMVVDSSMMQIYPFVFDLDRYRLGVQGYNDLNMNFNYHIAVLKSPLPFKFGINIKGNPDDFKVRVGGAKFNEKDAVERVAVTDTTRLNLLHQIENMFRRGVDNSRFGRLKINSSPTAGAIDLNTDTLTRADSVQLIREGLIPAPPGFLDSPDGNGPKSKASKVRKNKKKKTDKSNALINTVHDPVQPSIVQLYATLPRQRLTPGRPVRYGRHTV